MHVPPTSFLSIPTLTLFIVLSACTQATNGEALPRNTPAPASPANFQAELLEQVNLYRSRGCRCGARKMPPVEKIKWDNQLEAAARRHARDMAEHDHFSHTGTDGSSSADRATAVGYQWQSVGENIAWGAFDAASVVQTWIDSPGHCRNIMNPDYREMGIAKEGKYWSQVLGRRWE